MNIIAKWKEKRQRKKKLKDLIKSYLYYGMKNKQKEESKKEKDE